MRTIHFVMPAVVAVFLFGCGGGDSSSTGGKGGAGRLEITGCDFFPFTLRLEDELDHIPYGAMPAAKAGEHAGHDMSKMDASAGEIDSMAREMGHGGGMGPGPMGPGGPGAGGPPPSAPAK